jgi:hypothetical protein
MPNNCQSYSIKDRLGKKLNQLGHMKFYGCNGAVYLGMTF